MISARRIADGIGLAFDLARKKPGWEERRDLSAEAVFASFWALPLMIPGHLLAAMVGRQLLVDTPFAEAANLSPAVTVITQTVTLLLGFGLQLFVLTRLARRRGAGWRISPLIIAFNWAAFAFRTLLGLLMGLSVLIGVPALIELGTLIVFGLIIWVRWGIVRETLQTTPMATIGTLVLLVVVSLLAGLVASAIFSVLGLLPEPVAVEAIEVPSEPEAQL
ncbi:hypothetical protein [Parvularcula maris]|uniref:Yip1 domain-containing protein n=1 Tax=Parvularcula maris TaxID=2965077 RepID=A0A9X2LB03_9PROT|nr:hypothetical protein [Parvularcula maris]MCQ8186357.1 hypothetical protein [Parvularcula maris]